MAPIELRALGRRLVRRVDNAPPRALAVVAWVTTPRRAARDVRSARRTLATPARGDVGPSPGAIVEIGRGAVRSGAHDTAARLLAEASIAHPCSAALRAARRRTPGFVGDVPEAIVSRAIVTVAGPHGIGVPAVRSVRALRGGRDDSVEALVRHTFDDGRSMIRKSAVGSPPREVLVRRSGVLGDGGPTWRPVRAYHIEEEPPRRWHLFLEDLGNAYRPRPGAEILRCARALGELGAMHAADSLLVQRHPWLADGTRRAAGIAAVDQVGRELDGVVDDEVCQLVDTALTRLHAHGKMLKRDVSALPPRFCHGDAHPGNLALLGDRVVLVDWSFAFAGPLGTDLAFLVGLADRARRVDSTFTPRLLAAFVEGAGSVTGALDADAIELAFRHRFVVRSLRWQMSSVPPRTPEHLSSRARAALGQAWSGRRRSRVESNLVQWCAESDALVRMVSG